MTEEPVTNKEQEQKQKQKQQRNQHGADGSRDGSFQPHVPAVESFNLYLKDENSGLISLVNRDSSLTEQEIALRQRESISLSELVQRQENGDVIAQSFVSAFEEALTMTRGLLRERELKRLQQVADETFRRGKYAPLSANDVYQSSEGEQTHDASNLSALTINDDDNLSPGERLFKLFEHAESELVSEFERQAYLKRELTKIISSQTIQAEAVENLKINGGAAWFALESLVDGTVVDLLVEPGARHSPLFHTLVKTLDAIYRAPQAVGKALTILGNQIDISQK
jgi:hypothetical protein